MQKKYKIFLLLSFIPYGLLVLSATYSAIFGINAGLLDSYIVYGWEAIEEALVGSAIYLNMLFREALIGHASPIFLLIGMILPTCVAYQIIYLIIYLIKKKKKQ